MPDLENGQEYCGCGEHQGHEHLDHEHHDHEHHDHEHHDHEHHGHEHHGHEHHDHEHHDHKERISVTMHDSAAVGTVNIKIPLPLDEAGEFFRTRLEDLAAVIENNNGFIGHIKGIVSESGRKDKISITESGGSDVMRIEAGAEVSAEGVAIVFGISVEQLEEWLKAEFPETA